MASDCVVARQKHAVHDHLDPRRQRREVGRIVGDDDRGARSGMAGQLVAPLPARHGVEIREHQVTGGQRLEAVLDPPLAARLNEARGKVEEHERHWRDYERWASALDRYGDTHEILLHADDLAFFRIGEPPR